MKEKRDWDQVIKDYQASGMTVNAYCKDKHISVAAFYKNKKILKVLEPYETNTNGTFTQINIQRPETITFTINGITITCSRNDIQVFLEAFR